MLQPHKKLVKSKPQKEDKVLLYTAKAQRFYERYSNVVLIGLGALVLLAVVGGIWIWSQRSAEANSAFAELLARDAFSRGDIDSTLARANAIIDEFPSTNAAATALMLKARAHEMRAQYGEAEAAYREVIRKFNANPYYGYGAHVGLAAILFGRGEYLKAAEEYQRAATKFPKAYDAPNALIAAGEAFEKVSRYDDAKRAYQMVLSKYPKSRSVDAARKNLAALEFMR